MLRANIYTDPQKPIQVQPGVYEINNPSPDSPLMVTTNFSHHLLQRGQRGREQRPARLAAGRRRRGHERADGLGSRQVRRRRIAKAVKTTGVADKINHKRIILPGQVAVLSGELEEELPGWEIKVGPARRWTCRRF